MSGVSEKVDHYINKNSHWKIELAELRSIFLKTELVEEVKWGASCLWPLEQDWAL